MIWPLMYLSPMNEGGGRACDASGAISSRLSFDTCPMSQRAIFFLTIGDVSSHRLRTSNVMGIVKAQ